MKKLFQRQTSLSSHVVQFGRFLRKNGFETSVNDEIDLLKALALHVPHSLEEQQDLYKAMWVKNRRQHLIFDELYEEYWKELKKAENSKIKDRASQKKQPKKSPPKAPSIQALKNWLYAGRTIEEEEIAAHSSFETIINKDFSKFHLEEQKALLEIIKIIANRLANKYSRRFVKTKSQIQIDLKNTIKQSFKKSGSVDEFVFKKRQKRKVNIVLLCDVSKSMELYSKFLIEFMYSFQQVVQHLKTFVFSTQLVSLSHTLKDSNFEKVLENLSEQMPYWSSGTRIGTSFDSFVQKQGNRLLNKDSIVIIMSDGWDTGDIDILANAMRFIHKKSHRVIWLNPLAGNPNYKPETKAMKVCLPYIDVFTSAHNLESLKTVSKYLHLKSHKSTSTSRFARNYIPSNIF